MLTFHYRLRLLSLMRCVREDRHSRKYLPRLDEDAYAMNDAMNARGVHDYDEYD